MNTQLAFLGKRINMAPRTNRRRLVIAMYVAFAAMIEVWYSRHAGSFVAWCLIGGVVLVLILLQLVGEAREATDERELHRWDHARARAYPWLGYMLLLAMGTSQVHRNVSASLHPVTHAALQRLPRALVMAAGVLYLTLPQAILLWTEPDMEEDLRG